MTIVDRRFSVAEGQAVKAPCRVATTANITLSGEQTIDGLAVVSGDRVLVKDQSAGAQNGIYECSTGAWTRTRDFDGSYDVVTGTRVYVTSGTLSAGIEYVVTTSGAITVDTTAITFGSLGAAAAAAAATAVAAAAAAAASETAAETAETNAEAAAATAVAAVAAISIASVADRTALKALDTTVVKSALLRESGREGTFAWTSGNFTSLIAADAQEGIYVKATAIASSSGAWVRVRDDDRINAAWFGTAGYTAAAAALSLAGTIGKGTVVFPDALYDITNNTLTVPAGINVVCSPTTIIRRSTDISGAAPYGVYTAAMVSLGNYCRWTGGVLDNTAVLTTSASSNTIGTVGTRTFTVSAGLGLTTSSFVRIYSRANPANHFEGTVSSYSGTTLVVGGLFANGSGTLSDWNICHGGVYQAPMVLHGVTGCIVENVRVTGDWYVGFLLDGWNPSGGGSLTVSNCVLRNCYAEAVQNRGFYVYGTSADCVFDDCFVLGSNGVTDYGFNFNPANATGTANSQVRTKVIGCSVVGAGYQGYAISDLCFYFVVDACVATTITNAAGVGFLVQLANSQVPQFNNIKDSIAQGCAGVGFFFVGALYGGASGCSAIVCGIGYHIAASGGTQSQYIDINSSEAVSSTTIGFQVAGNSSRCGLNNIKAISNGTNGVQLDSGSVRTQVSGRSYNNTSNNLVDNGTSSITASLTVA